METQELIIVEVFCQEYEVEINFIQDLEAFGLIETIEYEKQKYLNKNHLASIEKIIRMHNDLNINKEGIEIILDLLKKNNHLEYQIKTLKERINLYE